MNEVKEIKLGTEDVILVRINSIVSNDEGWEHKKYYQEMFPNNKVIFIDKDIDISIIHKE